MGRKNYKQVQVHDINMYIGAMHGQEKIKIGTRYKYMGAMYGQEKL